MKPTAPTYPGADRCNFIGKERDAESSLGDHGVRKYDMLTGRFTTIDPLWEKYYSWSPYQYSLNNPIVLFDDGGLLVTKIIVNVENATATVVSDISGARRVPVAVGINETPSPSPGTTLQVRTTAWGPESNLFVNTRESWQTDKSNPYGPAIIILETKEGEKSDRHLHGTVGETGEGTKNIGGDDPENRKFTHGCVRFTNDEILKIMEEGVELGAPVEFTDDEDIQEETEEIENPESDEDTTNGG